MGIFTRLQQASLDGVPFLFKKRDKQFGRTTVTHEFINSNSRFVEDLGGFPPIFEIDAEISDTSAQDYQRKKQIFEAVLNKEGILKYVDPFYGAVNVVADLSTISESITDLNVATYTIILKKADLNIFPTASTGNKTLLNRLKDQLTVNQKAFFDNAFSIAKTGIEGFNYAKDTLENLTTTIKSVVSTINGGVDEVADFVNDIQDFQNSISSLIQTPSNLSTRLNIIFDNVSLITDNFEDLFRININLIGIGGLRSPLGGSSSRISSINDNNKTLYSFSDVACISTAFQASTNIDYSNQDQLDSISKQLNDSYNSIFDNIQDDLVLDDLVSIRNQTRLILENIRLNLAKIVTIRVNSIPVTVLAYKLYGDTTRDQEILSLNKIEDPAFIQGEIRVLSK